METKQVSVESLSAEEQDRLYQELQAKRKNRSIEAREAYESCRDQFLYEVEKRVIPYAQDGVDLIKWMRGESSAFMEILKNYGKLKRDDQLGFTAGNETFRVTCSAQRVKGFDERADVAAKRLVDFLKEWIKNRDNGEKDPMYQLCMTMIQRNDNGELDNKSISRLYEVEESFNNTDYSEIMSLFRESFVIKNTVSYFTFEKKDKDGNWKKVEVSFCRM
jgi:hypothetical protein